jgi:hypothetical protein
MTSVTLKEVFYLEFQKVITNGRKTPASKAEPEIKDSARVDLKDIIGGALECWDVD